jgi:deoxyadenosine/deoxycytidine kinase
MSNFRQFVKSLKIDLGSFNAWADKALNPKMPNLHKRLFDSYDKSLRAVEVGHAEIEAFVMRHIDQPDFERRLARRNKRLEALEALSVAKLKRIFDAYLRDLKRSKS